MIGTGDPHPTPQPGAKLAGRGASDLEHAGPSPNVVRFGAFEIDLTNAQVTKHGAPLHLQEQPFRILESLLERPGQVVSREELVRKLWPDGTYVDFDRGLNAAVTRLRQSLTDSAESPRYVETVARRGYRFIGQLQEPATVPEVAPAPRSSNGRWLLTSALVAILLGVGLTSWWKQRRPAESAARPIVPLPLTSDAGNERCPSLSPDGRQVVFESDRDGTSHLFVKVIGPGDALRLTSGPKTDFGPAWSPDGRSIAFVRAEDPLTADIFVMPALGGVERRLTRFTFPTESIHADSRILDWTPDSNSLVVSGAEQPGSPVSLYLVPLNSGPRRRLTQGRDAVVGDFSPAISPDGRRMAYTRGTYNSRLAASDIYVADLKGDFSPAGAPRKLTSARRFASPIWSADGSQLIFSSPDASSPGLFRMSLEPGAVPSLLPGPTAGAVWPTLRSGRLVFSRGSMDSNVWRQEIVSGHAQGTPVRIIASSAPDGSAQYSPDGSRIALMSSRSGYPEIWTCGADGQRCIQLTSLNGPYTGSPRWSPDGARIAFDSAATSDFDIYVIDANGGVAKRLGRGDDNGVAPSWSRDGKWIYFSSRQGGQAEVWKVESRGGTRIQVTRNGGFLALESPDGNTLYYTNDIAGSRLLKSTLDGGGTAQLLEDIVGRSFAVTSDRIYYEHWEPSHTQAFRAFTLATGVSTIIAKTVKPLGTGLSLSPDGRYLLYSQIDEEGSDLVYADNVR